MLSLPAGKGNPVDPVNPGISPLRSKPVKLPGVDFGLLLTGYTADGKIQNPINVSLRAVIFPAFPWTRLTTKLRDKKHYGLHIFPKMSKENPGDGACVVRRWGPVSAVRNRALDRRVAFLREGLNGYA